MLLSKRGRLLLLVGLGVSSLVAGLGFTTYWTFKSQGWTGDEVVNENDAEEDRREFLNSLNCEDLTRGRSYNQYWTCLVDGPTKYLTNASTLAEMGLVDLEEEEGKLVPLSPSPVLIAFGKFQPNNFSKEEYHLFFLGKDMSYQNMSDASEELKDSRKESGGKRRKMVKRANNEKAYKPINDGYILTVKPIKEETERRKDEVNDPFFSLSLFLYKRKKDVNDDPPFDYSKAGRSGPKSWHKLSLEKFLVPVNPDLSLQVPDRLIVATFSELWDEATWIFAKNPWFNWLSSDQQDKIAKLIFKTSRTEDKDFKFAENGLIGKANNFRILQLNKSSIPYELKINEKNRAMYDAQGAGSYSFMRFYIPPRPSQVELKRYQTAYNEINSRNTLPNELLYERELEKLLQKLESHKELSTTEDQEALEIWAMNMAFIFMALKYGIDPTTDRTKALEELRIKRNYRAGDDLTKIDMTREFLHILLESKVEHEGKEDANSLPVFPRRFPICRDREQSPLDIDTKKARASSLPPYIFGPHLYKYYRFQLSYPDEGTDILSLQLTHAERADGKSIELTHGATRGIKLYFETMLIKFGADEYGSEHKINGKGYAMELQLVFSYLGQNKDQSYWFTFGRQQTDLFPYREKLGLILSVMVEVKDMADGDDEAALFEPLAQVAYEFRKQFEENPDKDHYRSFETPDYTIRLGDFIPHDSVFYTYRGSLTFPPCFSYVTWSVYERPIAISSKQITEFRMMHALVSESERNSRTPDDIWVEQEHLDKDGKEILPSESKKKKEERISRTVLKSLKPKDGFRGLQVSAAANEVNYDYYFDASRGVQVQVTQGLILMMPVSSLFVHV